MKKVDEGRIEQLLAELTLEEKIAMIHGEGIFQTAAIERLEIPPLVMSDGPMGVRKEFAHKDWINIYQSEDKVSYLPSNSALASTWNRELAYETGKVLGAEARGRGKDVILAPGINIKRSPLCGRNFEYMSEDPKLIEELVVPMIKGIQENDVAACVKHFAANNQETERLWVDTEMEERALREIYFPGFKAAIDRGESHSLMGAYNMLFGEHCSQSKYLLNTILREEWGYDGAVISDWGGIHDTKAAAESELDIEMSVGPDFDHYYMANPLLEAVRKGEIGEELIDRKIRNILRLMLRLNMLGEEKCNRKTGTYNAPEHREATLKTARESIILLKNEEGRLPMNRNGLKKLAVIGQNAVQLHSVGGGSAEIKALYEISPLLGLKLKLGGNTEVKFALGYDIPKKQEKKLNWQQQSLEKLSEEEKRANEEKWRRIQEDAAKEREKLFREAVSLAEECDEVIFIGGLNHDYDVEGSDRKDMKLPYGQDELIQAILEVNPNAVIVMIAGSPVEMKAWSGKAKAILWSYYAGMEGGIALAEVLLGEVNPSGKLAETFPKELSDSPAHKLGDFGDQKKLIYRDGVFVGYRYYDTRQVEPEYAFGHGLSYTDFQYKNLKITLEEKTNEPMNASEGTDDLCIRLSFTIKNTGNRDGSEIAQVYVSGRSSLVERPVHELKGFAKIFIKAGEEARLEILLDKTAFGYYATNKKCFYTEPGQYEISIGSSSRDIRLTDSVVLSKEYRY